MILVFSVILVITVQLPHFVLRYHYGVNYAENGPGLLEFHPRRNETKADFDGGGGGGLLALNWEIDADVAQRNDAAWSQYGIQ